MVADGNIIADIRSTFLISTMDAGSILYIDPVADSDIVHIAPYHGIKPDAAIITSFHIANNGSIRSDESVFSKSGFHPIDG
jgi:hypothetical protein